MIRVITNVWSDGREQEVLVDASDYALVDYGSREGALVLTKEGVLKGAFYNWNYFLVVSESDTQEAVKNGLVYERPRTAA